MRENIFTQLLDIVGILTLGTKRIRNGLQTVNLLLDRYHTMYSQELTDLEIETLTEQCALFLDAHKRIPNETEIDEMLSTYLVR